MKKGEKFLIEGNRYREHNYLIFDHEKDGKYYFKINTQYGMYRIIYAEDNKTIEAIDPSGGPYMSVGDIVPIDFSAKIVEITDNFIICQ